jgi:hypothetical protein
MKSNPLKNSTLLAVTASILSLTNSAFAGEKLKVFILAGQSNTVGHARAHTMATLYHSGTARDKELIQLVFKKDSNLSKKTLEDQLTQAQKLDELTGGISNDKIKRKSKRVFKLNSFINRLGPLSIALNG